MFLQESYYGKDGALLRVDNIFKEIRELAQNNGGRIPNNINNSDLVAELNGIIAKKFNFESCDIFFIKDRGGNSNAYTIPVHCNLYLGLNKLDPEEYFELEENANGLRFKNAKGKNLSVTMYDDIILKANSPEAATAILLHEIGHNFFYLTQGERFISNFMRVVAILISIFLNPEQIVSLLMHLKFMLTRWLESTIVGRGFSNFVSTYLGWVYTTLGIFSHAKMAVYGPLVLINYILSFGVIGTLIQSAMSKLATRGYENEIYSDAFAASYGYGKDLYAEFYDPAKFTNATKIMNDNAFGGFLLQMEYICLTASYIADPHPTALHRTEFIKNKLEVELEHTRNPVTKKAIKEQLDAIKKFEYEMKDKKNIQSLREAKAALFGHFKNSNAQAALLSLRNHKQIEDELFLDTKGQGKK